MKKVYLIHGFEGSPNGGWRPWLMAELEKQGVYACALSMPNPDAPELAEWISEIKQYVDGDKNDEIYLVGHSLGGTAILRFLEKYPSNKVKGIISVSAPCNEGGNNKVISFLTQPFDWSTIKANVPKCAVIHGDNDPYVPVTDAEEIARELNGQLILIPNGQHLNGSAGFDKLPECLDALLAMMKIKV